MSLQITRTIQVKNQVMTMLIVFLLAKDLTIEKINLKDLEHLDILDPM